MVFRTIFIIIGCFMLAWATGCGGRKGRFTEEQMQSIPLANRYELPSATGGMVMSLASETITYEEILNAVEQRLRPAAVQMDRQDFMRGAIPLVREAVRSKAADILLYAEARKHAPSNIEDVLDKAVDKETNRFVAGYGNNYALAEAEIRKMGMDWRTFREYQKKLIMTHSYLSSKVDEKVPFTHRQMLAHYESVRDEQFCQSGTLEFHAIDLIPEQLTAEQISGRHPVEAARELAETLAARARAGEDFAELARQYSHGPLARSGGKWLPVTVGANTLPQPYDVLETTALGLEPGEISDPIITPSHIFVMRLDSKEVGGCKPFEEVQHLVERQLQFEHRRRQYDKYINELVKQADLVEMERFVEFCVNAAYERWKAG